VFGQHPTSVPSFVPERWQIGRAVKTTFAVNPSPSVDF
jgi:hypothetical protein